MAGLGVGRERATGLGTPGALSLILLDGGTGPGKRWGTGYGEQCPQSLIVLGCGQPRFSPLQSGTGGPSTNRKSREGGA